MKKLQKTQSSRRLGTETFFYWQKEVHEAIDRGDIAAYRFANYHMMREAGMGFFQKTEPRPLRVSTVKEFIELNNEIMNSPVGMLMAAFGGNMVSSDTKFNMLVDAIEKIKPRKKGYGRQLRLKKGGKK